MIRLLSQRISQLHGSKLSNTVNVLLFTLTSKYFPVPHDLWKVPAENKQIECAVQHTNDEQ